MPIAVEEALRLPARLKQQEGIKAWRGKLPWTEDLNAMCTDKPSRSLAISKSSHQTKRLTPQRPKK